jgi:acyl dehydratase
MLRLFQVAPGTVVAQFETPPISRFTLALFCGASGDHNPVHVDLDFARAAGHKDVFAHGMLVMAYLGRLLPRPDSSVRLESFTCRFLTVTQVGDSLLCVARLANREELDSQLRVTLDLESRTVDGVLRASGSATVIAPKGPPLQMLAGVRRVADS